MASRPEDHLGFVVDDNELDRLLARWLLLAEDDRRVEFRYVTDGRASSVELGDVTLRTFFVRFLLPIWFQLESRQPNVSSSEVRRAHSRPER